MERATTIPLENEIKAHYETQKVVEQLQADCVRLQQEINCLRMEPCQLTKCEKLESENTRLRSALEKIAKVTYFYSDSPYDEHQDIAKEALSSVKPERGQEVGNEPKRV